MPAMATKPTYPDWFRDALTRIDENAFPVRLNVDCREAIAELAEELGWSEARVLRILVHHSLRQMGRL